VDPTVLQAIATALLNFGLAWAAGAIFVCLSLDVSSVNWRANAAPRLPQSMQIGLSMSLIGLSAALWLQAAIIGDVPLWKAESALRTMLGTTYSGRIGLAGLVVLSACLAFAGLPKLRNAKAYAYLAAPLIAVFGYTRAASGHAGEQGAWHVAVWIEWLHWMAVALWVGIVATSAWLILPRVELFDEADWRTISGFLTRLSQTAAIALAGVAATGVYNAYRSLGQPAHLVDSSYGQVLVAKLLFVILAIALGAYNRFIGFPAVVCAGSPSLLPPRALPRLVAVLRLESFALLAALIAAAVLIGQEPPASVFHT
jgi:putative copper export protein